MADVKISALTAVGTSATTDIVPVVQAGVTKQATLAQIKTAIVTPAGSTGEVQYNNAGAFGGATNVLAGSGYVSFGATPATTGTIRLANGSTIYGRDAGNTQNVEILSLTAGDVIELGASTGKAITIGTGLNQVVLIEASSTQVTPGYIQLGPSLDMGAATGPGIGLHDATVVPSTNPTDGVIIYSEGGVAKVRRASGTIDTIGAGTFTAPTGTGVMTVTSGAMDAASTGLGTGLQVLRTNAGATDVEWAAAASGSPGGSDTYVQFNDSSAFGGDSGLTYNKTTDVLSVATAVGIGGGTQAAAGMIRVKDTAGAIMAARRADNTVDKEIISTTSTALTFGDFTTPWSSVNIRAGGGGGGSVNVNGYNIAVYAYNAAGILLSAVSGGGVLFTDTQVQSAHPIIGLSSSSSPFSVHGGVTHAFASDANYTVTAAQYCYDFLSFTVGSWTIGRTITFPHPATLAAGYYKTIDNGTGYSATISTGTGTTVGLSSGVSQRLWFDNSGVAAVSGAA